MWLKGTRAVSAMLLLGVISLAGCQSVRVTKPMAASLLADDEDTQMEYWASLDRQKLVSNNEAFHGLLLYLDQHDTAKDYAARVSVLKSRKMLPAGFDRPADEAVTRGTLAVAVCQILHYKGGVMMHLLGPQNERYATRELNDRGDYTFSSPQQTFSGPEFRGIISHLGDVQLGVAQPVTDRLKE